MITVIAKINNLIEKLYSIEFKCEEGINGNNRNDNNNNNNNNNNKTNNRNDSYDDNNNNRNNNNNNSNNNNNDDNNYSNSQFNKDINTRTCQNTVNYSTENQNESSE